MFRADRHGTCRVDTLRVFTIGRQALLHALAEIRSGPLRGLPIPCRLPSGGWFLSYGDEIGLTVLGQSLGLAQFEPGDYQFVVRFVRPGMTCLDIGANQGVYTIQLCRRAGSAGRVVAFEPLPMLAKRLAVNLALNRCSAYTIERSAVGGTEGSALFHVARGGKESYSALRPLPSHAWTAMTVSIVTLDAYVEANQLRRVDFVKIDAEGAELEILEGGRRVFEDLRPTVLCELADVRTRTFGYSARLIYEFLAERSYRWFQADARGCLRPSPMRSAYAPDWANLVAVPDEKRTILGGLLGGSQHATSDR